MFVKLKQPLNLARAEIKALCAAYGAKVRFTRDYAVLDGSIPADRLVYSHFACAEIEPEDVKGTFKIEGTKKEIAAFAPKISAKVDLEKPKNIIRVWNKKTGKEVWRFRKIHRTFVYRHHLTLDSELARFLVNLAGLKAGQKLLDPFCGTGSALIEAGKAGARVFGSDTSDEMIFCAKENLEANGICGKLVVSDISSLCPSSFSSAGRGGSPLFDTVVTDLPYGRCSALHGKSCKKIYSETFGKLPKVLKTGGYAVLLSDKPLKTKKLKLVARHRIYAHKSLTRFANVFRN